MEVLQPWGSSIVSSGPMKRKWVLLLCSTWNMTALPTCIYILSHTFCHLYLCIKTLNVAHFKYLTKSMCVFLCLLKSIVICYHSVICHFCYHFCRWQVITELLDVEKNPQKPQYTMASGQYMLTFGNLLI